MLRYAETLQSILSQVDADLRVETARDDSLVRRFRRHDLIIINPRDTAVAEGVALMDFDGTPTAVEVKRMRGGLLRFTKHDMLWRPIEMREEEAYSRTIGRVVGAFVRFKPGRS